MRLPAISVAQKEIEAARAFHEAVWAACEAGTHYRVLSMPETVRRDAKLAADKFRKFWDRRGYRLHCRRSRVGYSIDVWVEPKVGRGEPSA